MPATRAPEPQHLATAPGVNRWHLFLVIATVTAIKIGAILAIRPPARRFEDTRIAFNLLSNGSLSFRHLGQTYYAYQFPTYPLVEAAIFRLAGASPLPVLVFNVLVTAVTAWVLAAIFELFLVRMADAAPFRDRLPAVVWTSVVAFLLDPAIAQYSMLQLHPLAIDTLAFYVPVALTFWYVDRGWQARDLVILGVATGLVMLTRVVLVVNLLPLVALSISRDGWRSTVGRIATVGVIALCVGAPWLIRTYRLDGVVGYTSTTGEILWKGALPGSEGSNFLSNGNRYLSALSAQEQQELERMPVAAQNRYFLCRYVERLASHPKGVALQFLLKLRNFFWFRPQLGNDYGPAMRRLVPAYEAAYAALLTLAIVAVWLFGRGALLPCSLILGLGFVQSIFYVETRHRAVIEPLLIFLASATVVWWWYAPQSRQSASNSRLARCL
jgi:hypothetical protein